MLTIKKIASGSGGNCHLVSDNEAKILLDCGIPFARLQKALGQDLSEITACLISHEHKDHSLAIEDLLRYGIPCYLTEGTYQACFGEKNKDPNINIISPYKVYLGGAFNMTPFHTEHDAREPVGFYISFEEAVLLYATDTYYLTYRFSGLTHIIIECNYSHSILNQNVKDGIVSHELRDRVMQSHLSLDNLKGFLGDTDLSRVQEIHLMHPSKNNLALEVAALEIKALTGKPVYY